MKYNMWTHAGINEYKHVLTFVCVQVCVGPVCPCIGACMFLNINPLNSVYIYIYIVCSVCWDPPGWAEPDRPPCCVSVCPIILTLHIPPPELDIKQMKWTHIPSRWASIWKHKALMRSPSALLPHTKGWGEKTGGKNDKAELPWAATQTIDL